MSTRKRLLTVALAATALLSLAASSAHALRSISVNRNRMEFLDRSLTFADGGVNIVCEVEITVRLLGQAIQKIPNVRIGEALIKVLGQETRGRGERCSSGRVMVLGWERETPTTHAVEFVSYRGTLPDITHIHIHIVHGQFQAEALGQVCLITADIAGEIKLNERETTEDFEEARSGGYELESVEVRRVSGIACPRAEEVSIRGAFTPIEPSTFALL
jgi:hypothetical protein